jgi:hypothetical protein
MRSLTNNKSADLYLSSLKFQLHQHLKVNGSSSRTLSARAEILARPLIKGASLFTYDEPQRCTILNLFGQSFLPAINSKPDECKAYYSEQIPWTAPTVMDAGELTKNPNSIQNKSEQSDPA